MALLTLARAKHHLRITTIDQDGEIAAKLEAAEAIIIDYLKARVSAISSISVASPTVITTAVPHGLTSGAIVTITGTTSTPALLGSQAVTVTSPTTLTVPVAVTVGQAEAAGTVTHRAWTATSLPGQVEAAILLVLGHLWDHRGDELLPADPISPAVVSLLMRSRDPALA